MCIVHVDLVLHANNWTNIGTQLFQKHAYNLKDMDLCLAFLNFSGFATDMKVRAPVAQTVIKSYPELHSYKP